MSAYDELRLNRGHVWSTFVGFCLGILLGLTVTFVAGCGPSEPSTGRADIEVEEAEVETIDADPVLEEGVLTWEVDEPAVTTDDDEIDE